MRDRSLYLLYRAGSALLGALPLSVTFHLGQTLGFLAWLALPKYRRLALRNASTAFGNTKSRRDLRRLVRRHFSRLGANLLSSVKLTAMPLEEGAKCIETENLDAVHRELRAGKPVVLILSHLGSWELFAQLMPRHIGYVRNSTIYQKLSNRLIDEHVKNLRGRAGVEMFDRKEGFQDVIGLLRGGGAIGILSDQHAGDQGLWVPFFGRLASTSPLPALLAKRTGATLIGLAIYTIGTARWRIVATNPLPNSLESVEELTAKGNELIAHQIRLAPEDWFWVHNRWKTPRPNFLLSNYKRGVYLPPPMTPNELKPFRILIRSSNWLGDAVMSVPAVRAIKQGRPDGHVTILTSEKIAPLWKLISEVDEVLPLRNNSLFSAARLIRRQQKFDAAILFPNSLRAALESWLGGVSRRVGYRGHARAWFLNQIMREPKKPRPPEHQSLRYLRMAQDMGADIDANDVSVRKLFNAQRPTPNAQSPTASAGFITSQNGELFLGLCPGAEYGPAKRWLPERFAEAAAAIASTHKVQWILLGTSKDADVGEIIAKQLGDRCVNRIGQTTLEQLIDQLRTCRMLLTNDTGTMHLASLLGIPTVAIFGSTEPGLTGPLGNGNIVLRHHVECSPCFLRECPIDFRCMNAVTVQEVVDAILSTLPSGRVSNPDDTKTAKE